MTDEETKELRSQIERLLTLNAENRRTETEQEAVLVTLRQEGDNLKLQTELAACGIVSLETLAEITQAYAARRVEAYQLLARLERGRAEAKALQIIVNRKLDS